MTPTWTRGILHWATHGIAPRDFLIACSRELEDLIGTWRPHVLETLSALRYDMCAQIIRGICLVLYDTYILTLCFIADGDVYITIGSYTFIRKNLDAYMIAFHVWLCLIMYLSRDDLVTKWNQIITSPLWKKFTGYTRKKQ